MSDLISRCELFNRLASVQTLGEAYGIIQGMDTVDAVQVRHGQWIDETFKPWGLVHHLYKCDQCGDHSEAPSDYCPHCGARMDGKGDGNETD